MNEYKIQQLEQALKNATIKLFNHLMDFELDRLEEFFEQHKNISGTFGKSTFVGTDISKLTKDIEAMKAEYTNEFSSKEDTYKKYLGE